MKLEVGKKYQTVAMGIVESEVPRMGAEFKGYEE